MTENTRVTWSQVGLPSERIVQVIYAVVQSPILLLEGSVSSGRPHHLVMSAAPDVVGCTELSAFNCVTKLMMTPGGESTGLHGRIGIVTTTCGLCFSF